MDFNILCESLKELYGNNNDYGLFVENMTEADKSNLLRNFDGGAAFGNLKGWIPFSGYDLFTTSAGAFADIFSKMKPWDHLSYEQKKRVVDFSSKQWALNTDESRYVAALVLELGVGCQKFGELSRKYSDDGNPYSPRLSWRGRKYTEEDAFAAKKAFNEFKEWFNNQSPEALDGTKAQNKSGESQINELQSNGFVKPPQDFPADVNEGNDSSNAPVSTENNEENHENADSPEAAETVPEIENEEDPKVLAAKAYLAGTTDTKDDAGDASEGKKDSKKVTTVSVDPKTNTNQPKPEQTSTPKDATNSTNPNANEVPPLSGGEGGLSATNDENDKGWFAQNWQWLTGALAAAVAAGVAFFLIRKQKKKTKKANETAETLKKTVTDLQSTIGTLSDEIAKNQAAANKGDKSDAAQNTPPADQNTPPADTPSQDLPDNSQNDSTLGQNCNCDCNCNSNSDSSNSSGSTLGSSSSIVKPGKDQIIIQTVNKEY